MMHVAHKKRPRSFARRFQQSEFFLNAVGKLVAWHIRFVHFTSKERREPRDSDAHIAALSPAILTTWHGQFLMIPCCKPKAVPVSVMVARHTDGEMIARAIDAFDMGLIRGAGAGGSGKDRGGMEALRAAVQALRSGVTIAMTADIPPGPARVAGLGVVMIARISGRPIIPVATATSRLITFSTWSRFTLNLPFSKMGAVAGEPIYVPRNADGAELELYRQKVEDAVNEVTARAYAMAGSDAKRVVPQSMRPPPRSGFLLDVYRGVTTVARPLAPIILNRRAKNGKELAERLPERLGHPSLPRPKGPLFWFHAASVGETNAILPLMDELGRRYPALHILLTTGTVTSANIAQTRLAAGAIHQFLPLDTPQFVRRFIQHWKPDAGIFIESEIWPNLIVEATRHGTPLILVNARMSQRSAKRWARYSSISKPVFARFDLALTQNWRIGKRLTSVGVRKTVVTGNLKHDAPAPPVNTAALDRLRDITQGRFIFLAASTHPGEDEAVMQSHHIIKASIPNLLTVIAPRHPVRGDAIAALLRAEGLTLARRSTGDAITADTQVYLADTIGEMGLLYSLAQVSFIGGSLVSRGGQNPIEAIKLGSAVISGPHTYNFAETYEILQRYDGCVTASTVEELAAAVVRLARNPGETAQAREKARSAILVLSGALDRTLQAIEPYIRAALDKHGVAPPETANRALSAEDHAA